MLRASASIFQFVSSSAPTLRPLPRSAALTVVASKAVIYDGSGGVVLGNWRVIESGGNLFFQTGGTSKMKLDTSGNLTVTGNVTAFGSV